MIATRKVAVISRKELLLSAKLGALVIKIKAGKGTGKVYNTHAYHANIERKPAYVNIIQNLQTTNEIKLDCR